MVTIKKIDFKIYRKKMENQNCSLGIKWKTKEGTIGGNEEEKRYDLYKTNSKMAEISPASSIWINGSKKKSLRKLENTLRHMKMKTHHTKIYEM